MRTSADDAAFIQYQNLLRVQDRADPLCHNDDRTVLDVFGERLAQRRVGFHIQG